MRSGLLSKCPRSAAVRNRLGDHRDVPRRYPAAIRERGMPTRPSALDLALKSSAEGWGRLPAALTSAAVAIAANTLALRTSDAFGLETARGGLLRLLTLCITVPLRRTPSGAVLAAQVQEAAASPGAARAAWMCK